MSTPTADILGNLRDAPVMNLFVLVGFMLVVLAAVGRLVKWKLDVAGRLLSGVCGVGLLVAATMMFLGLVKARESTAQDLTAVHGGTLKPSPSPGAAAAPHPESPPFSPPPVSSPPAARPPAMHPVAPAALKPATPLPPKEASGSWGCEETKTIRASLTLPEGAEFRSATVEVVDVDKAKSFRRLEPAFDQKTRTVSGAVEFRGFDKVFFNCPGGGHATVRLNVTAAVP